VEKKLPPARQKHFVDKFLRGWLVENVCGGGQNALEQDSSNLTTYPNNKPKYPDSKM
jgi:hypothetical protein